MNKELIAKLRMTAGTEIRKLHQNKVFSDRELLTLSNLLIPPLNGGNEVFDEFMRKYTEVIVKECAGVAEVSMPINSHPDDRLTVKNKVLQHFGVDE